MKVSILSPDLSRNNLGRAYLLAKLLDVQYETEIIGPVFGDEIWSPISSEYVYKSIETKKQLSKFSPKIPEFLDLVSGDILYISKPRLSSYGLGLIAAKRYDLPVVLDIDDWESGFQYQNGILNAHLKGVKRLYNVDSFYYTRILELAHRFADGLTVSNSFLQHKFGGNLIYHARSQVEFDPSEHNQATSRKELNLPAEAFIVMFVGTPRPHKGLDDLINALESINKSDIIGVIVGVDNPSKFLQNLSITDDTLFLKSKQPFRDIPKWLSAADVVVVPQKSTYATKGQLPTKVFDGMAMAKPTIATNVNDLPFILKHSGIIVKPGKPEEIKRAILKLYLNENLCNKLGENARKRFVDKYSYEVISPLLIDYINKVSEEY